MILLYNTERLILTNQILKTIEMINRISITQQSRSKQIFPIKIAFTGFQNLPRIDAKTLTAGWKSLLQAIFFKLRTIPGSDANFWQWDENSCYKQNPSSYQNLFFFQTLWIALQTLCVLKLFSKIPFSLKNEPSHFDKEFSP